jgi:hypothetical protein
VTDQNTEAKIEKLLSDENLRPGKWYHVTANAVVRKNAAGRVEYNTARVTVKQLEGEPGAPGTTPPTEPPDGGEGEGEPEPKSQG